jgi:cell division septation protein DedD
LWSSATGEDDEEEAAGGTDNGRAPLASRWTQTTKVDRTAAAAERTPSPDAASTASSGNTTYRVQLAAVRSESEAQTAWDRLASEHETLLAGHEPVIEKSEGGASGPVYRVQVGPFADKSESAQLCNAFKNKGVDCFLVAR